MKKKKGWQKNNTQQQITKVAYLPVCYSFLEYIAMRAFPLISDPWGGREKKNGIVALVLKQLPADGMVFISSY